MSLHGDQMKQSTQSTHAKKSTQAKKSKQSTQSTQAKKPTQPKRTTVLIMSENDKDGGTLAKGLWNFSHPKELNGKIIVEDFVIEFKRGDIVVRDASGMQPYNILKTLLYTPITTIFQLVRLDNPDEICQVDNKLNNELKDKPVVLIGLTSDKKTMKSKLSKLAEKHKVSTWEIVDSSDWEDTVCTVVEIIDKLLRK
jgi:hypothetical protein